MKFQDFPTGRFYNEDCFDAMKEIPDGVIDMILCDLPYGTTQNKWDSVLDLEKLWKEYWRVAKENAAIVLTASQPFTSKLLLYQIENFKYEWIWRKNTGSNFANASRQPLKYHENILVFYREQCNYNKQPQIRISKESINRTKYKVQSNAGNSKSSNYGEFNQLENSVQYDSNNKNPESIIDIKSEPNSKGKLHPTQKPVALFEYLIKTYTNENELILDNCAGSGTTAIAAINTNRKWVCIEKETEYYDKAINRIINHGWK